MQEFLNQTYLGNSVLQYLTAIGIFIFGLILVRVFKLIVLSRLKVLAEKTTTSLDDFFVSGIEKSVPLLTYGAFYIALKSLNLSPEVDYIINIISIVLVILFAIKLVTSSVNFTIQTYVKKQEKGAEREKQLKGLTSLINLVIWGVGIVFLLDNLGVNISAVVAGLGIGGIAVALAAQAILGDLFSYFVIFFDRPFEIGDFILVGDKMGSVEYIGIKTTRLRALGGEQLVFSNTDLTNSRIHNYKKMAKRRVVFKLGVIYQTTPEQLKEIPAIVEKIIEEQPGANFDRGHFSSFGDFSLDFEFVYYVLGADYKKYMDIQQSINLEIFNQFSEKGIEFAYPSQTLFVTKEEQGES